MKSVQSLFIALCVVAGVGALAGVSIDTAMADKHNINGILWAVVIVCIAGAAYLVKKLIGTNRKD